MMLSAVTVCASTVVVLIVLVKTSVKTPKNGQDCICVLELKVHEIRGSVTRKEARTEEKGRVLTQSNTLTQPSFVMLFG